MIESDNQIFEDIRKVESIPIIQTMLEVVCRTTGMGFAAVARVTEDKWIACSVRDEIQFGLQSGGELELKTTLCHEVRTGHEEIVINHVKENGTYANHHTPAMYGFQSYISYPIVLRSGEFFGTLCAIDPHPAELNNPKTIGMFKLFTELIAFHLHSIDLMDRSQSIVHNLNKQLKDTVNENRQYQYISNHNLQEPLRKLRLYSNKLSDAIDVPDLNKAKELVDKISSSAQRFSMIIKDLSDFSELTNDKDAFETIDLNIILSDVCAQLKPRLDATKTFVTIDDLPVIRAIRFQMEQLFYHLMDNAIKFAKKDIPPLIRVSCRQMEVEELPIAPKNNSLNHFEIRLEDNGIGIEKSQLEKIFDIFSQVEPEQSVKAFGVGLAYCRKIIHNHGGSIKAQSEAGQGTVFTITLPLIKE